MKKDFSEFNLSDDTMKALSKMSFESATPVQSQAIGPMLEKRDIVVQAPTGTGKTAAFGIPLIESIDVDKQEIQSVILSPTRELAMQIADVLRDLTRYKKGIKVTTIYGGEPIEKQIGQLKKRPQIVVATPGRMLDHMNRRTVRFGSLKLVVLDEADRMLDMGFRDDLDTILQAMPEERQTVMFSATMSNEIRRIAETYQKNAQDILIEQDSLTVETVEQYYTGISGRAKGPTLVALLQEKKFKLSLVFVGRKHVADEVARTLRNNGFNAAALHGDMRQGKRNSVMSKYRNGKLDVLVATDVAARGIDVDDIDVVINYDLPQDSESYVHRIGRTGRADKNGVAYTFITSREYDQFNRILADTKAKVPFVTLKQAKNFRTKPDETSVKSEHDGSLQNVISKEKAYRKSYGDKQGSKDGRAHRNRRRGRNNKKNTENVI